MYNYPLPHLPHEVLATPFQVSFIPVFVPRPTPKGQDLCTARPQEVLKLTCRWIRGS